MPWHRSDDGFPEHPKCDALTEHFGDDWATLNVAFALWHHMGCDCAARRTDGVFNSARAYRVMRAPREVVDRSLAGLRAVGLLDKHRDGFVFHDWHDYQPTRADLDAERAAKSERQKRWRENRCREREVRDGRVDASTSRLVDGRVDASGDGGVDGAPSRPVPARPVEEQSLSPVPPAAAPLAAPTTGAPVAARPKRPRAAKADDPPPFSVDAALAAIVETAGRRFVVGDSATWAGGWVIALRKAVRRHPDLATWRLVGSWLAAGFGGGLPTATFGVQWAASNALADAVAKATAWAAEGSPAALDARGYPVRAAPAAEALPDPWAAAMRRGVQ